MSVCVSRSFYEHSSKIRDFSKWTKQFHTFLLLLNIVKRIYCSTAGAITSMAPMRIGYETVYMSTIDGFLKRLPPKRPLPLK